MWVDENLVQPRLEGTVQVDRSGGGVVRFDVGEVWDDDLQDRIYLRWFVDWEHHPSPKGPIESIPPNQSRARDTKPFDANFCGLELQGLTTGLYLVEAVVSDREFVTDETNRTPATGASLLTLRWEVQVSGPCPPQSTP